MSPTANAYAQGGVPIASSFPQLHSLVAHYPAEQTFVGKGPAGALVVSTLGNGTIEAIEVDPQWISLTSASGLAVELRGARDSAAAAMMMEFKNSLETEPDPTVPPEFPASRPSMTESVWVPNPVEYLEALKAEKQELRLALNDLSSTLEVNSARGWFQCVVSRGIVSKISFDAEQMEFVRAGEVGAELVGLMRSVDALQTIDASDFATRFPLTFAAQERRSQR